MSDFTNSYWWQIKCEERVSHTGEPLCYSIEHHSTACIGQKLDILSMKYKDYRWFAVKLRMTEYGRIAYPPSEGFKREYERDYDG